MSKSYVLNGLMVKKEMGRRKKGREEGKGEGDREGGGRDEQEEDGEEA